MKTLKFKIISFVLTFLLLILIKGVIIKNNGIDVVLDLKSSKDVEIQLFYTTKTTDGFTEENSKKISLVKSESMEKLTANLNINKIKMLRIDFGEYPGVIDLENIQINGKKKINVNLSELKNYNKNQIKDIIVNKNSVSILSDSADPYIIIDDLDTEGLSSMDILLTFTFLVLFYFLIYKFLLYLKIKKMRVSWINLVYIFLIAFVFIFPVIGIDNDEIDAIENRTLAKAPKLKKNNGLNLNFGKDSESWLNDHFYKRRVVITFYKIFDKVVSGRVENENAFLAKEGWYFYKGDNSVKNYQNIELFSEDQLKEIENNLLERKKWMDNLGIKYYTFVAPDKNKIYGEFYPSYIKKINKYGKVYQLREYLKHNNEINIVYPYEEIMKAKENGLLYWKTDTHWNEYGAYVGYLTLMSRIKSDFPELEVKMENNYTKQSEAYLQGDLAKMLGINSNEALDVKYDRFFPINGYEFTFIKNADDRNQFIPDSKYDFNLFTSRKHVITTSPKPLKVLIFTDSLIEGGKIMLFSSLIFLSIFLPVVTGLYFMVKKELRNYVLLVASLIFYAWGEPRYLAIMLLVIIINYVFAILVENEKYKKIYLAMAVIGNLSFLVYFKYFNFIIENLNKVINSRISFIDVIMPIGISFYTFQALSYVIDVYRGEVKAQKSIYNVALYVTFFPQLIAGPIVKYHDIEKEIIKRTVNFQNIYLGLKRFSFGLGKKIIFANTFGAVVDQIFGTNLDVLDYKIMWLGAICYSLQLYFDFSGYSDMAIGLGQIFGFHFLENFNYPYISKSITEFWRRWHISLGSWFKEYLYIPLGGNRKGQKRTYVNLFIVFLATGIWHGASWTFVIWGLWHGIFIIIERYFSIEKYNKMYQKLLRYIYTVLVFIIGWVIFRADTLSNGIKYLRIMFGLKKNLITGYEIGYFLNMKVLILLVIGILASVSVFKFIFIERNTVKYKIAINVFSLIIIIISMILISSSTYNPFIYFRF